jgi:DME family drug/metabolite transporter
VREGRLTGLLAITVTSVLWGTTGTAATFASGVGPLAIGAAALGIAGLLQAAIAVPALRTARPVLRRHRAVVVTGAISVAVYPLAFYSSMHTAGVAVGSVVSLASAPLASGVLERLVDGRALSRWWVLAASLGVLGSALLCASEVAGLSSATSTLLGIGLGLVAGTTYALYSWAAHRLMSGGSSRAASRAQSSAVVGCC